MLATDNADIEEKEPEQTHDNNETPTAPIRIVL